MLIVLLPTAWLAAVTLVAGVCRAAALADDLPATAVEQIVGDAEPDVVLAAAHSHR